MTVVTGVPLEMRIRDVPVIAMKKELLNLLQITPRPGNVGAVRTETVLRPAAATVKNVNKIKRHVLLTIVGVLHLLASQWVLRSGTR